MLSSKIVLFLHLKLTLKRWLLCFGFLMTHETPQSTLVFSSFKKATCLLFTITKKRCLLFTDSKTIFYFPHTIINKLISYFKLCFKI